MEYIIAPPLSAEGAVLPVLWKMALTDLSLGSTKIYPSTAAIARYRVIQRDCHKWKCYQITLNQDFIDFWGIFRFHILGGLLFKATLDPNRHFWLLWPIFWCPIVFEGYFVDFFQKHKFGSFTVFLYGSSNVGQSQLIFVWPKWFRQVSFFTKRTLGYFPFCGAHLQKSLRSSLAGRKRPTEQPNGYFPEKEKH